MTASYFGRLACISLAVFFVLHYALSALLAWAGPRLTRRITRDASPRLAARYLFGLRMTPAVAALVCVIAVCIPSYLLLEPDFADEEVGAICLAGAFTAVAACAISIREAIRAAVRGRRFETACRRVATGQDGLWVVDSERPLLAMAGLLRPRLLLSAALRAAFTAEQLDAALRHERAHWASRDNLKRLLLLAIPVAPGLDKRLSAIDREWATQTEQAADDSAVAGDSNRALALASALVAVARMGSAGPSAALVCSLTGERSGLAGRVDRLLAGPEAKAESERRLNATVACWAGVPAVLAILAAVNPGAVHSMLEGLLR